MKYFIPNWEDRLDPEFDFQGDKFSENRTTPKDWDIFAHNIFSKPAYDGVLMSMNIFDKKISVNGIAKIDGNNKIDHYLKFPKESNYQTMCDCGAFSYINDEKPPERYTPEFISKIYETLNFKFGVSVDHLMNKNLSLEENEQRRLLSLSNAEKLINYHNKNDFNYIPVGAAQGYNFETFYDSVSKLSEMGYKYIGLGTLIPHSNEFIIKLLETINPLIKKNYLKIHLFGVLRKEAIKSFQKLLVNSFDSASFLRKAWLRSNNNYLGSDLKWYPAIRVHIAPNKIKPGFPNIMQLKRKELNILSWLEDYDKGLSNDIDGLVEAIIDYDSNFDRAFEKTDKYKAKYKEVLESKIWKKCDCEMCKSSGIHVMIFRRANRNKRRGFHNTWTFYQNYLA